MTCDICKQEKQGVVLATDEKGTVAICPDCVKERFPAGSGADAATTKRPSPA